MKLNYYPETDSLYIDLSERPSVESREISEGILLDYDANGRLVGIDIDNASNKVEMEKLILSKFPAEVEMVRALTCIGIYGKLSKYVVVSANCNTRTPS